MAATPLLDSLQKAHLLPSPAIPADFTPTFDLTVQFPGSRAPISPGTLVRVSEVRQAPTVTITAFPSPSPGPASPPPPPTPCHLTLLLIDPDAPTPDDPKFAYWRHWVVTGIPAPSAGSEGGGIEGGRTLTGYLGPGPKDESGPHRYLFLLFAEPAGSGPSGGLEKGDVGGEEFVERRSFGVEGFVKRHGLRLVGVQWMRGVGDGWKGEE